MAENLNASVQMDRSKVAATRLLIDGLSKKMEIDLKDIQNGVNRITENWESDVSARFASECAKKLTDLREENATIDRNLKTFLDKFVEAYDSHEQFLANVADLFR